MMKKMRVAGEWAVLLLADGIVAAAVFFFLMPSRAAVSSIAGLSMMLTNVIPLPVSVITMILNVFLLILGFLLCGPQFGIRTIFGALMLSVYLMIFEQLLPGFTSLTGSQELDVVCYVLVVSFGLSIMFALNAASGGLDIVAMIANRCFHVEIGKAMAVSGFVVALSSALFYDSKTVVLSLLGTYCNGKVLDAMIFDRNVKRRVCIISGKLEEFRQFIISDLHSGASINELIGGYSMDRQREIITIVDRDEYRKLMDFIRRTDPKAFVTVYKVSEMQYTIKPRA